jgi:hypothetical protein
MSRWAFILVLVAYPATAKSQSISVSYHETIRIPVPGALAAFSLDDFYAEAKAQDETLTIFGKNPGVVHVVAVMRDSTKTFEVSVLPAPPSYPPGFVQPVSASAPSENGSYESRYTSGPSQSDNIVDFMSDEGNQSVHFHLSGLFIFHPLEGQTTFSLDSVFYQILTPRRDLTVLDEFMDNSPLTVDGSIVRGFHFRQGGFLFHTGYASITTFENFVLPSLKEGVIGVGYRFSLSSHSSLTPNFYFFPGRPASENIGQRGTVASVLYNYEPRKSLGLLGEVGFSRGAGVAARFHFEGAHDQLRANLRYEPLQFASLSLNSLHGFYSDVDWTRQLTSRLTSNLSFTGDHYRLRSLNMTNVVSGLNLQLQLFRNWSLFSGATYGSSKSYIPPGPPVSALGLPLGVSFYSRHFQGGFVYQYSRNYIGVPRSDEFRATLGTQWTGFRLSGFADRQTQAPTIGFTAAGVSGLQEVLDNLAISATTPEQIAVLLRETAGLENQGFVQGVNISLTPVRLQAGADLTWFKRTPSRQQFHFSFLYNKNELVQGANQAAIGSLSYSSKFKNENEFFASLSLLRSNIAGTQGWRTSPLIEISIRHPALSVPHFLVSGRTGTIRGVVFADDGATGMYRPGEPVLTDVVVVLDDARKIRTDHNGHYLFTGVSLGSHSVGLDYQSAEPFFFTTASRVQTDADTAVNFGVAISRARLIGSVHSDAQIGLASVEINISKGSQRFTAQTDSEGTFRVEGLSPGEYDVGLDTDSVPPGYAFSDLETQRITVEASVSAHISFTVRAIRNISGRVIMDDRVSQQEIAVPGVTVLLQELSRSTVADANGFYLIRDLPAGTYNLIVIYEERESKRQVTLPVTPAFLKNIQIAIGTE